MTKGEKTNLARAATPAVCYNNNHLLPILNYIVQICSLFYLGPIYPDKYGELETYN